jgi:hypothetical protein
VNDEEAVLTAVKKFYAAIEDLMIGKGMSAMRDAWHHTPNVTAGHPLGDWSHGWKEVDATWSTFESLGKPELGGSSVEQLRANVYGDVAYTTCVFVAGPAVGRQRLNCTNVVVRLDGAWKLVHHHADKSSGVEAALEQAALEG